VPHRFPGRSRRVAVGSPAPRHAVTLTATRQIKRAFIAVVALLALVNAVLLGLHMRHPADGSPGTALPWISPAAPPTALPNSSPGPSHVVSVGRAVRQVPRPRPTTPSPSATPVLLGPADLQSALTTYCQTAYGQLTMAFAGADGWECAQFFNRARPIDMNAACRSLYGSSTWADLLDDNDQRSWRCYRAGP
jgi:hypothetical protein